MALATSALSFLAPYNTPTMALHTPLVNFLSRLNTDVGAGAEKEFLTTILTVYTACNVSDSTSDETYTNVLLYWLT